MKKKGIKVRRTTKKHYKSKKGFSPAKLIYTIIFIVILTGIAFVGYQVADSIANYIDKNKTPTSTDSNKPKTTDITDKSGNVVTTPTEPIVTTTTPAPVNPVETGSIMYYLKPADLANAQALTSALGNIPPECSSVVVPLRSYGGYLNYKPSETLDYANYAKTATAIKSDLSLTQIYDTVITKGFKAVADVDLLNDNLYPKPFGDTSFKLASTPDWNWYDGDPNNGGKLWLSPFSVATKSYLTGIVTEISSAGFENIIFSGISYPPLRPTDYSAILNGDKIKSAEGYAPLTDLVKNILATIPDVTPSTHYNSVDIFSNTAKGFKPDVLKMPAYVDIDLTQYTKVIPNTTISLEGLTEPQKLVKIIENLKILSPSADFVPVLVNNNYDKATIEGFKSAVGGLAVK
jgi:hypothetical protein